MGQFQQTRQKSDHNSQQHNVTEKQHGWGKSGSGKAAETERWHEQLSQTESDRV